jgi:hypothetical protein
MWRAVDNEGEVLDVLVQTKRNKAAALKLMRASSVPLAEDDDMVKAFPPDRANQPFRMSILPWRAGRGWPVRNAHGTKPPGENFAIDPVTIADDAEQGCTDITGCSGIRAHSSDTNSRRITPSVRSDLISDRDTISIQHPSSVSRVGYEHVARGGRGRLKIIETQSSRILLSRT